MPKKLVLYMSREDEEEFLNYLRLPGNLAVLPATSPTSDFGPVSDLPEVSEDEATRNFWLQNLAAGLPLVTEFVPGKGYYVIDGEQSPIVEFVRSRVVSRFMLSGRIQAVMNFFDSDEQSLVPKPAEFRKWFESMENWIRKKFTHLGLLTYAGPGAEKFRDEGGFFH